MSGWRGRPRNPYAAARAEERREREAKDARTIAVSSAKFARLMRLYRRSALSGADAERAWREPKVRTYHLGKTAGGDWIDVLLRRDDRGRYYLQEASGMGWRFSRLVPRFEVPRAERSR